MTAGALIALGVFALAAIGALVKGRRSTKGLRGTPGPGQFFDLHGNGRFEVGAVGESHYQDALLSIVGARHGYVVIETHAELSCEDDNAFDRNAVRVMIEGKLVAYLSREVALAYRRIIHNAGFGEAIGRCQAKIYGGSAAKPSYGVWLDI
jgi:hypothetical protein